MDGTHVREVSSIEVIAKEKGRRKEGRKDDQGRREGRKEGRRRKEGGKEGRKREEGGEGGGKEGTAASMVMVSTRSL